MRRLLEYLRGWLARLFGRAPAEAPVVAPLVVALGLGGADAAQIGGGNNAPTAVNLSPASHSYLAEENDVVGTITVVDGDSASLNSLTFSNAKYKIANISGLTAELQISATGEGDFTAGVDETGTFSCQDSSGNNFTSPTKTLTVTDPAAMTLLDTLTVTNDSGSTQAANWISRPKWIAYKKGDVPAGTYPAFRLNDGTTPVPFSWGGQTYWPDGSLMGHAAIFRVPASVSGSGTISLKMYNGGAAPSASGFGWSTLAANTDFKLVGGGLKNLAAGTWTSALNTAIAAGGTTDLKTWMDGDAGWYGRAYQEFNDGSSDNTQVGAWHYVGITKDSSGTVGGYRILCGLANGWFDVSSPQIKTVTFKDLELKNGSTTIRAVKPGVNDFTFTRTSSNVFTVASTSTFTRGFAVHLTNSGGALPAGLSADTAYYVRPLDGTTVSLHTSLAGAVFNGDGVTTTDAGSGTHTAKPTQLVEYYAFGPWSAGSDGHYDYVAGTIAGETTCRIDQSLAYMLSTKLFAPLDPDVNPTGQSARTYATNKLNDFVGEGNTGERDEIGYWTRACADHIHLKTAATEQTVRVQGLDWTHQNWSLRRSSTRNLVNLSNVDYTNLGTKIPSMVTRPSNPAANNGSNDPENYYERQTEAYYWNHHPNVAAYAYMMTGEQQYLDMQQAATISGMATEPNRTQTWDGTTFYGTVFYQTEVRGAAWLMRDIAFSAGLTPDNDVMKDFFVDIAALNMDAVKANKLDGTSFAQTHGILPHNQGKHFGGWQLSYLMTGLLLDYTFREDADTKALLEDCLKMIDKIRTDQGLATLSTYFWRVPSLPTQDLTTLDLMGSTGPWAADPGEITWDAGTDTFTMTKPSLFGAPADGDIFVQETAIAGSSELVTAGIAMDTIYYLRDVAGSGPYTFKLATSPGGSPVDLTASGTTDVGSPGRASVLIGSRRTNKNSDTSMGGFAPKSYTAMLVAVERWCDALGMTFPSGLKSAIETAATNDSWAASTFNSSPIYGLRNTFE